MIINWAPPLTTNEDMQAVLAVSQAHILALTQRVIMVEDQHNTALAMGLHEVHEIFCLTLSNVEADLDRALKAVWS